MNNVMLVTFAVAILAAISVGAVGYVFLGPVLGKHERNKARLKSVSRQPVRKSRSIVPVEAGENQAQRRQKVQATLKEIEKRRKTEKVTLSGRIQQAGLEISVTTFLIVSAALGLFVGFLFMIFGYGLLTAVGSGLSAGFGVPRWILKFLCTRRQKVFLEGFAVALEVIVRGVKGGLPLHDCLRIIAFEGDEPVRSEFRELVEGQGMGMTLEQGLIRMYEHMPLPEVNFLMIILTIQQKTGGNLSETLSNLAQVLRDRKLMRAKIQALSAESKAGALIIGSLPPAVMGMIYMTSPDYMGLLFSEPQGHIMIICSGIWMGIGILVMKRMINLKF